jgi:glycosyltransferase involved in cell wall biosynthesis
MRILEVIDIFAPSAGGSAYVASRLSQTLSQRGHQVIIYTSNYRLEQEYLKTLSGVKVYAARNYLSPGGKPLFISGIPVELKKELRNIDVIHLHNYPTMINVTAHRFARQYHIPYVLQAHGSLATYFQRGTLKRLYDRFWGKSLLKDAAKAVAVAPAEVETYRRMGLNEKKIEIVPNGVDASEFENLPPRGQFRKKHGLEERKVILYLGRIHATKGLDILVGAFAAMLREKSDARLIIAGPDDGYLPALKKLAHKLDIEEKTIFTGALYGRDKLQAMVDADVFVMPSAYEIFGIAVLEACICGTPVIVTDRCGIAPEITADLGQVIRHDESALRDALLKALGTPAPNEISKEKRRQALLDRFSWQKLAVKVEGIYLGIISDNQGNRR